MKTPSPALAVATLALAVALTGTAGAASGWINGNRIKPHSITAKQIKTHAITKATLADGISDPTVGPAGPKGDAGPAGATGAPGKDGTAKAFAYVNPNGFIENSSGNVTITHPAVGTWCVTSPGTIAVVSVAWPAGGSAYVTNPSHNLCDEGTFEVQTVNGSNTAADRGFNIIAA